YWDHVQMKFDNSISENNRVSLGVLSNDSRFSYGSGLTPEQLRSAGASGFGQILLPQHEAPLKTYAAEIEGRGERPPVRSLVGIDSTPFVEILRAFTVGLIALTRSEEHTSQLQSRENLVCRLLLEKKNT